MRDVWVTALKKPKTQGLFFFVITLEPRVERYRDLNASPSQVTKVQRPTAHDANFAVVDMANAEQAACVPAPRVCPKLIRVCPTLTRECLTPSRVCLTVFWVCLTLFRVCLTLTW